LLVEDNPLDVEFMSLRLESMPNVSEAHPVTMIHAESVPAACYALRHRHVDVVMLTLASPDAADLGALSRLRDVRPGVPIIVLGERSDEAMALAALRAGAQDYVLKPAPDGASMRRILRYSTERQRLLESLDAAVHQAQRAVAARDRAVGIVSHDLRNPLGTIKACAAALLEPEPAPAESVRQLADIIQRSVSWMEQIVQDLLDRSSLDAGKLALARRPTSVSEVIMALSTLFAPVAQDHGLRFNVDCSEGLPALDADPNRLIQVLSNLLSNAMKFTGAGGTVTLGAEPEGTGVRFSVRDSGCGIEHADLAHIFDWFWQAQRTSRTGAGLGLAIAKGLIEAHESQLHVESEPGRGSTFWFVIPPVL
jgi:signal transduction histidine kinase